MTRSHLTPAVITDKNGKVTTVHRKQESVSPTKNIPSPSRLKNDNTRILAQRISDAMFYSHGRQDMYKIKILVSKLDEFAEVFTELVESVARDLQTGNENGTANMSYIAIAVSDGAVTQLKNMLQFRDIFPEKFYFNDVRFVIKMVNEVYEGDKFSADYHEKLRAHLYASSIYERQDRPGDDYSESEYEGNMPLFDLVMRRPQDVEEIMRLHNDYKVPNITDEVIEEYRKHHPTLGHGIL